MSLKKPDYISSSADAEKAAYSTSVVLDETVGPKKKWYKIHWFEPGTSKEEKWLILKLDFFLLTYSCAAFFLKYLDSTNITNAYSSGMKEELNLTKNQLSWMNTYFNIGVIIGSIPSTLSVSYFRPRYFLPTMDLLWSLCVLFVYKCHSAPPIYALRFLMGLFESSANPCVHFLIGSWYKKSEILRRSSFFVISGIIGQALSGFIQGGLISLDGVHGLSAWRWLFIFDAILGLPVILYGLFAIPDTPSTTQAFYLNQWERERAVQRIEVDGRTPTGRWDWTILRRVFLSWQFYGFVLGYAFWTLTAGSYVMQFYTLYLKYWGTYTVRQINYLPTSLSLVNLIFMLSSGVVCDLMGRRWPWCMFVGCILIFTYSVMLRPSTSHTFRLAAYTITGVYGCFTPILSGWANITCGSDQQLRAFTLASMIVVGQIVVTPFQQKLFPSSEAPFYKRTHGFAWALAFVVCLTLWTSVGLPLLEYYSNRRKEAKDATITREDDVESETSQDK